MDKCKYKRAGNERACELIHGECQFILCRYGPKCPIYHMLDWRGGGGDVIRDLMFLVGEMGEGSLVNEQDGMMFLANEEYDG